MTPNFSLDLVEQGDEAYKRKDYLDAQRLYQQALEVARANREDTNYIYSSLTKVYKKNKNYRQAYLLSKKALPTPAAFRDCATCLRSLAKEAKKASDSVSYRHALEDLYKLGAYACLCYGEHNCQSGVSGAAYDRAVIMSRSMKGRPTDATFERNGKIVGGGLLTEADYIMFADAFGESDKTFIPQQEYATMLQVIDEEMKRREEKLSKSFSRL
jgi:tetratricopeptide (TPR) repeat protein